MICRNCGTPLEDDATVCTSCGTAIAFSNTVHTADSNPVQPQNLHTADPNPVQPQNFQAAQNPRKPKKSNGFRIFGIVAAAVVAVLLFAVFSGNGSDGKTEPLVGTWQMIAQDSPEEADYLMDYMALYDEEKELVDPNSLNYTMVVSFTADGHYSFAYDADGNKACVREFYLGVMDALYEGRATLSEIYGTDLESMTREEFNSFYAEDVYSMDSYEALIDDLAESAYDYAKLSEPLETGTYELDGSLIVCTVTGETAAESMGYKIIGNTLTLTYSDGNEFYTRVN